MEQPDQVQRVIAQSQMQEDAPAEVSWNDKSVEYQFKNGVYYCKDLPGAYMSVGSLTRAWKLMMSEKMVAESKRHLRGAYAAHGKGIVESRKRAKKAMKDIQKWSNPDV